LNFKNSCKILFNAEAPHVFKRTQAFGK